MSKLARYWDQRLGPANLKYGENANAAGPPVRLQTWIREAADDMPSTSHPDDNRADHGARGSLGPKKHMRS
ncbi:hypothetical protein E4U13_004592 [Claviceps humidiphila]|uniref:Uncharacterized protein n=1 Tax=Claviceps humidiphila TaxID=1294629 RepID=A0A9P7TRM4_9HYPO|nr:hypothetical protein E4U13_004592 [Claviceps humidiphila]